MTAQTLDRILTAYRSGDPNGNYKIFDATGSKLYPGRWNSPASPMIYASGHYSTALLEKLVHGSGRLPPNQHFITITIPPGTTYEILDPAHLPTWADPLGSASKVYGEAWQLSKRGLLLVVPSVVARMEQNCLINQDHSDFHKVQISLPRSVWWDKRLFS